MRRNARWLSIFLSLNLLASSAAPVAFAQGKPKTVREELAPDLRKEWDLGLTLFGDGNYRGAIVQFQRVYDTSKNPRVLQNIARSYQELKNYPKAVQLYERVLSEGGKSVSAADQADIKSVIGQLRSAISTLDVQTNTPGVVVNVDGEDMGVTPLPKPIEVSVASHVVKLSKSGFREQTRNVDVGRGTPASLKVEMVPEVLMADVTVTAEGAPKANIRIDGVEMGASPYRGKVEVGKRHKFEAYSPGFVNAEQSVEVNTQEPKNVFLTMSVQRAEGRVAVIARPAGAIISIDQKVVGTDKWEGVLPTGGHMVKISKSGYIDFAQEIGVANDQVRTVETTLRQDATRGAVMWSVGAALVLIAGGVTIYALSRPKDGEPVNGTVANPPNGIMPTWFR